MTVTDDGEFLTRTTTERQALIRLLKHALEDDRSAGTPAQSIKSDPGQARSAETGAAGIETIAGRGGTMTDAGGSNEAPGRAFATGRPDLYLGATRSHQAAPQRPGRGMRPGAECSQAAAMSMNPSLLHSKK